MKKFLLILTVLLPLVLPAQVASTGNIAANPANTAIMTDLPRAGGKIGLSELLNRYAEDNRYKFFEINEEMFKAFCELENADSTSIALFKKIKSVKMLEIQISAKDQKILEKRDNDDLTVESWFYSEFTSELDQTGYIQLLKSSNNRSLTLFLKKEFGPADNEFLLITDKMVIDIRGDIKVKTIYQMEEMMSYVQQILPY
jgi:hypothetical protein